MRLPEVKVYPNRGGTYVKEWLCPDCEKPVFINWDKTLPIPYCKHCNQRLDPPEKYKTLVFLEKPLKDVVRTKDGLKCPDCGHQVIACYQGWTYGLFCTHCHIQLELPPKELDTPERKIIKLKEIIDYLEKENEMWKELNSKEKQELHHEVCSLKKTIEANEKTMKRFADCESCYAKIQEQMEKLKQKNRNLEWENSNLKAKRKK